MSYPGVYAGIVKDTNDPESKGRVRVIVPEIAGTALLPWAAPAYGAVGTRTPVLNTQVWVSFKNGKVKYPVWIGYTSSVAADFAATSHAHVEYATEGHGHQFVDSTKPASDLPNTYPLGLSTHGGESLSTNYGWPVNYATITTSRPNGSRITQIVTSTAAAATEYYFRTAVGNTWNPWMTVYEDSGWKNLSFASGWEQLSTAWVGRYRRQNGWVTLEGLAVRRSGTGQTMATLPVGYRPAVSRVMSTVDQYSTVWRVDVTSAGLINWYGVTTDRWMTMYPINFPLD